MYNLPGNSFISPYSISCFIIINSKSNMKRMSTLETQQPLKEMKKSISFSGISANSSEETSRIFYDTILRCPICQSKVRNAHMCPNCCKLFCQSCIKNWVISKKSECPHCNKNLRLISIVNCEHLGKQIQEAINRNQAILKPRTPELASSMVQNYNHPLSAQISRSNIFIGSSSHILSPTKSLQRIECQKTCKIHQLKLDYYCQECRMGLCPDCAVLTQKHRGHKLSKLSFKQKKLQEETTQIMQAITRMKHKVLKTKQQTIQIKNRVKTTQQQKINYFFSYVKRIEEAVMSQVSSSLHANQHKFIEHKQKLEGNLIKLVQIQKQIAHASRSSFLTNQQNYLRKIDESMVYDQDQMVLGVAPQRDLIFPEFGVREFCIDNFSSYKAMNKIIFTENFSWEGIEWRLRILPNGCDYSFDPFLSVYLQMHHSIIKCSRYVYRIEIVSSEDPTRVISKTSESQFQSGTYWGYDKFVKLSALYDDKFISRMNDKLKFRASIRFTSFSTAIITKNIQITQRYKYFDSNVQKIRELQQKLGIQPSQTSKLINPPPQSLHQQTNPIPQRNN